MRSTTALSKFLLQRLTGIEMSIRGQNGIRFYVEGTMPDGSLLADIQACAPYAIFDEMKQDYVKSNISSEAKAFLIAHLLNSSIQQ